MLNRRTVLTGAAALLAAKTLPAVEPPVSPMPPVPTEPVYHPPSITPLRGPDFFCQNRLYFLSGDGFMVFDHDGLSRLTDWCA